MSPTTRAGWGLGVLILAAVQYVVAVLATLWFASLAILFAVLFVTLLAAAVAALFFLFRFASHRFARIQAQ